MSGGAKEAKQRDLAGIMALLRRVEAHPAFDEEDMRVLEAELALVLEEHDKAVLDAASESARTEAARLRSDLLDAMELQTGVLSARPNLMDYFARRQASLEGCDDARTAQ